MKFLLCLLTLSLLLTSPTLLRAADEPVPVLVMEFGGLKNNYRVVFEQWDDANHFASGALEIASNEDDKVHTRIPFAADVSVDSKDKKTEVLAIRCTALDLFFPPGNKKDPYPPLKWKLTGRKTKAPVLKAALWAFGKDAWQLDEIELEKAAAK